MKLGIRALLVASTFGAVQASLADITNISNDQYTYASQSFDTGTKYINAQHVMVFGTLADPTVTRTTNGGSTTTDTMVGSLGSGQAGNYTLNGYIKSEAYATAPNFAHEFVAESYSEEDFNFNLDAPGIVSFSSSNAGIYSQDSVWSYIQADVDGNLINIPQSGGTTFSTAVSAGSHSFTIHSGSRVGAGGLGSIHYKLSGLASGSTEYQLHITNAPEPATMALIVTGLAVMRRRRQLKV